MTVEELKAEAEKQGYKLVKIASPVRILPCPVCGCKRTEEWYRNLMVYRKCAKTGCSFEGYLGKNRIDSKRKWNEAVLDYKKEKENAET